MNIVDVPFNEGKLELPQDQRDDHMLIILEDYCFQIPMNMFYFIWDQLKVMDDPTRSRHSHAAVAEVERTKTMFDSSLGTEHVIPYCQDAAWHLTTILANDVVTTFRYGDDGNCPLQALGESTFIYQKTHRMLLQPAKAFHLNQSALN
jgi:hypothetical protein